MTPPRTILVLALMACAGPDELPTTTPPPPPPETGHTGGATASETGATDTAGVEDTAPTTETGGTDTAPPPAPKAVVLMIGDGMGPRHVEAGSWFAHGAATGLVMESLPVQATLKSASIDGITDSAASGTAMASGIRTHNAVIGLDLDASPVLNLAERAEAAGMASAVVTTSRVTHATPACFTAHEQERNSEIAIADQQVLSGVEVLLGGGSAQYLPSTAAGSLRDDNGLIDDLASLGYGWVTTGTELAGSTDPHLFGAFSLGHMPYVADRAPSQDLPSLAEMTTEALERVQDDPEGFFLMIEGARIDHASHQNKLEQLVEEVTTFDEAVAEVLAWADIHPHELTLIVTADHECGGLEVVSGSAAGAYPDVTWRWGKHTNRDVPLFASGPGTDVLDGGLITHLWVHEVLAARIDDVPFSAPPPERMADGRLDDLAHRVTGQQNTSAIGDDRQRFEALALDADADTLYVGIEGLFPWDTHGVALVVDLDFGASTGPAALHGALTDGSPPIDMLISQLPLGAPPVAGFGADLVVVSLGGQETPYLPFLQGARGLTAPLGSTSALGDVRVSMNYGPSSRTRGPGTLVADEGLEIALRWADVFPTLGGSVPPGTQVAVYAVGLQGLPTQGLTNQVLPSLPPGTPDPGLALLTPAGVAVLQVDADGDGTASGELAPTTRP